MKVILLIALMLQHSFYEQDSSDIIGIWEQTKKELRNGESGEKYTFDGKPYKSDQILELKADGTGKESSMGFNFEYKVIDDKLFLGNRVYIVEKLTKKELIILEYNEKNPEKKFAFRLYFSKRVDS